jgi:acetolactate synthase-1/2/3 large subunit
MNILVREPAEAILAVAKLAGVERLWFVSGNDLVSFQEAAASARERGLPAPKIAGMVHEHVALCIAMGEAMIRRAPAAVAAHVDVGLLHMGGALHNAFVGRYPVLILTGYPPITPERRTIPVFWKQQRWDQGEIVRQLMRWDYRLGTHDDPAVVTARALQVALSPPQGPVYLTVPKEVSHHRLDAELAIPTPQTLGIPRLGAGPDDAIREIARRLLDAERPLVITDKAGRDPQAVAALDALAAEFGLAVRASRHRMNLRDDHPSRWAGGTYDSAGLARSDGLIRLAQADALLVVDHLVPWIPAKEQPHRDAWVAVAGPDPVAADVPLYEFPADLRLTADPAAFLTALAETMRSLRTAAHRETIDRRGRAFSDHAGRPLEARDRLSAAMAQILEPEDALTWEMTDTSGIPRTRPDTLFDSGGSSLGWAVGAGIGIRLAQPDRFVACLTGDGAYMFGSPSILLWAQGRYSAPLLTVVANNRGYRTGTVRLREDYPDGAAVRQQDFTGGTFDPPPDFAAQARAAGGFGARVTEADDIVGILKAARHAVEADGVPAVVDVWLPPLAPRS